MPGWEDLLMSRLGGAGQGLMGMLPGGNVMGPMMGGMMGQMAGRQPMATPGMPGPGGAGPAAAPSPANMPGGFGGGATPEGLGGVGGAGGPGQGGLPPMANYGLGGMAGGNAGAGGVFTPPDALSDPQGAIQRALKSAGVSSFGHMAGVQMVKRAPEIVLSIIMNDPSVILDGNRFQQAVSATVQGLLGGQKLIGGGGVGKLQGLQGLAQSLSQGDMTGSGGGLAARLVEDILNDKGTVATMANLATNANQSDAQRRASLVPLLASGSDFAQQQAAEPSKFSTYLSYLLQQPNLFR